MVWIDTSGNENTLPFEVVYSLFRESDQLGSYYWTKSLSNKIQFSSVAQSCPTLCNPMNHSTPGLPVRHHLLEFTQTHIHRVSDAIQPSRPLSSLSPPAPNPSQYQSLFQWVRSSHGGGQSIGVSALASFLPKKSQGWSPSEWIDWISLQSNKIEDP